VFAGSEAPLRDLFGISVMTAQRLGDVVVEPDGHGLAPPDERTRSSTSLDVQASIAID
jgi:hypothetical protein